MEQERMLPCLWIQSCHPVVHPVRHQGGGSEDMAVRSQEGCPFQCSVQQQHPKRRQRANDSQVLDVVVGCMLPHLQMQRQP